MARNQPWLSSSRSGKRSARLTTPTGIETQALIGRAEAEKLRTRMSSLGSVRSTQDNSVEPPPTSTTSAASAVRSNRFRQPATDNWASSRGVMICKRIPVSSATRVTKSGPFSAPRQAWVATARTRTVRLRFSFSEQTLKAAMARSIAPSCKRPVWLRPSPSRTIREKDSTTRKPVKEGVAIKRRQLLVPRSSAANRGGSSGLWPILCDPSRPGRPSKGLGALVMAKLTGEADRCAASFRGSV